MARPQRVWAISSIHADIDRLCDMHDILFERFNPGDRVVYHGNYMGHGRHPIETMDEILTFRRSIMSIPGVKADDLIYLRGAQEEMWQKLLQIQFAPEPSNVLLWMLSKGVGGILEGYGISPHDGIIATQEGVMAATRWTNTIREAVKRHPGHETFMMNLKRAAYTDLQDKAPILFVHSGIDPQRGLEEQGDNFWWSNYNFDQIVLPYEPFQKVVRGYDPKHRGMRINCVTATIDGGCGFGGTLNTACFAKDGDIMDVIEV